jgi:hypothetical protein
MERDLRLAPRAASSNLPLDRGLDGLPKSFTCKHGLIL